MLFLTFCLLANGGLPGACGSVKSREISQVGGEPFCTMPACIRRGRFLGVSPAWQAALLRRQRCARVCDSATKSTCIPSMLLDFLPRLSARPLRIRYILPTRVEPGRSIQRVPLFFRLPVGAGGLPLSRRSCILSAGMTSWTRLNKSMLARAPLPPPTTCSCLPF
jgi:hypothetical protein